MAISSEFAQAVREKNNLRVRIMLKDSLLIDKSFRLFEEMQAYALAHGVNPWADAGIPLEKTEKPWTEDTMNYELTALVNDFTKEHVSYLKEIIRDIYKLDLPSKQIYPVYDIQESQHDTKVASITETPKGQVNKESDPYTTIQEGNRYINEILQKNGDPETNKRRWLRSGDISDIKRYAQSIVDACNEIQRRG
ncbi:hypothetical protein SAMN04487759_10180 [Kandleria vitulina]|jgi:hypothetical protein|uniref:Uncharacterized protein n=1 Tax=Kandleria vitulina TaxID=1630 RepID=A0A1H2PWX6_9FIRM|nr:hypothetical protein [Kandleria vitulina]SDV99347.1 hypothetical protein SAMN04487759_10180 [Kandleria vitulina]